MGAGPKLIGVGIGAIVLLVGLLGVVGAVSLSAAALPGMHCYDAIAEAGFSVKSANLTVTLTDKSQILTVGSCGSVLNAGFSYITLAWGDGTTAVLVPGETTSHGFATYQAYNIVEKVWLKTAQAPNVTNTSRYSLSYNLLKPTTSGSPKLNPAFLTTTSGFNVTTTDLTHYANVSTISISVGWGDGTSSAVSLGGSVSHTYGLAGTYAVIESDTAHSNSTGATVSAQTNHSVTVPVNPGGPTQTTLPSHPSNVNLLTVGLVVAGLATIILVALPAPPIPWKLLIGVIVTGGGMLFGFLAGGL
jgi:hypothetical protein